MVTKVFRVYGIDGHRQRESFSPSMTITTWSGEVVKVNNSDVTGNNEYSEVWITADNELSIEHCLNGQLSDGVFENCRIGKVVEVTETAETTKGPRKSQIYAPTTRNERYDWKRALSAEVATYGTF